jgi:hypothetical protein
LADTGLLNTMVEPNYTLDGRFILVGRLGSCSLALGLLLLPMQSEEEVDTSDLDTLVVRLPCTWSAFLEAACVGENGQDTRDDSRV